MKKRLFAVALLSGCAASNYAYRFDLTDPGARNVAKVGERATLEDNDVRAEVLVDPTSFQAILLDLTNKTSVPLDVKWGQIILRQPNNVTLPLHPDAELPPILPRMTSVARLVTFVLPAQGAAAKAFDNTDFELVVPMQVQGVTREYVYHLHATLQKL